MDKLILDRSTSALLIEQNPKGLGTSIPKIRNASAPSTPIEKTTFGCYGCPGFIKTLRQAGVQCICDAGTVITITATVAFQFLQARGSDEFNAVSKLSW